jgi:hypothetical protein
MTLTTATLGDHLAAQGVETTELYSRGARVRKRDTPVEVNGPGAATEFLAVKVVTSSEPEPVPGPRSPLCRITHRGGHVLEFGEWPEAAWLAALLSETPSTTS